MKILFGMPDKDSWGGPVYCEPPIVDALRKLGVEADEETYVYGEKASGVGAASRLSRVLKAAFALRKRARSGRYDLIHLNTSSDEKCTVRDLITLALLGSKTPVYLKMHGSIAAFLRNESPVWRALKRAIFRRAAGIGVLSEEERANFIAAGCPPEKLSTARLAINESPVTRENIRAKHSIGESTLILLFSSRFLVAKGILDVIKAFSLVRKEVDAVLVCLGDGPDADEAHLLATKLGLGDSVRFTGYIPESEATAFHAASSMFVFPTYHDEGFPIVILKSLAAGLPIVTTRCRAMADNLAEPENCLWTEPRDPRMLADKIRQLAGDAELRESMRANNLKLAEEFDPDVTAKYYLGIYEKMIADATR